MAGRPMRRSRGLPTRHEGRAVWWREQIATAATPAEQMRQVQRWLHAVAGRASPADRDQAYTAAARAVAEITAGLERRNAK
jgi:hypothetical protein